MKFTKMQAIGNDYIYINCLNETVENPVDLAITLSNRNFGIGSDGIILIKPSGCADFCMQIYNADGSSAKMCGNGIRCVAKYLFEKQLTNKKELTIETLSGVKKVYLEVENKKVKSIKVNMGEPILSGKNIPTTLKSDTIINHNLLVDGVVFNVTCVSMGNPHCVIFTNNVDFYEVEKIGKKIEQCSFFPDGTNVEFVEVVNKNTIKMRVWERGSGQTLSCGTGSCASVVACVLNGKTNREVNVLLQGGTLKVLWNENDNQVYMTGDAKFVFEGEIV